MPALVYDYKSIAANMKGELAPKESALRVHMMLDADQISRLRQKWEQEWEYGYGEFTAA